MCSKPPARSAPSPRAMAGRGEGPAALATLFALARGARGSAAERAAGIPGLRRARDDQVVRHQLPLPRAASCRRRQPLPPAAEPLARRSRARRWRSASRTRPVLLGPVSFLLLAKTTDGVRSARPARRRCCRSMPSCCASFAEAGARLGADRRALPRSLDLPAEARGLRARLRARWPRRAGAGHPAGHLFRRRWATTCRCAGSCRWPACTSTWCAAPATARRRARGAAGRSAGCRSARRRPQRLAHRPATRRWRRQRRVARRGAARALMVAPSCSLLHVPREPGARMPRSTPSCAAGSPSRREKLDEVARAGARPRRGRRRRSRRALRRSDAAVRPRRSQSARARPRRSRQRVAARHARRWSGAPALPHAARRAAGSGSTCPPFPTTTIGSFPQTAEVRARPRRARARRAGRGRVRRRDAARDRRRRALAGSARPRRAGAWRVRAQRHGRSISASSSTAIAFTAAWLGAVLRQPLRGAADHLGRRVAPGADDGATGRPMRSRSPTRPMKGMLTGPVTMLQWSFVRDDQPRASSLPADRAGHPRRGGRPGGGRHRASSRSTSRRFREGLPLRRADWPAYLRWAVTCFRLARQRRARRRPRSTPTCATRSSTTSSAAIAAHGRGRDLDRDHPHRHGAARRLRASSSYPNEIGPGV